MTLVFESEASNKSRMDDYFTTTIVGLPEEVNLGTAFSSRMLKSDKYVTIDAMTAKAWLSDPAREALKAQLKRPKLDVGLPIPAGKFARSRFGESAEASAQLQTWLTEIKVDRDINTQIEPIPTIAETP